MEVIVLFTFTTEGLKVKFRNLSTQVPAGSVYLWDFGDNSQASQEQNPIHIYETIGFYLVSLKVENPNSKVIGTYKQTIVVTDRVNTSLSGSIYDLIDGLIPAGIWGEMSYIQKRLYIEKWQLYLQPLVNHCIPIEEYNNELYYEALENQLIMELAAWDWLTVRISHMLQSITANITENTSDSSSSEETTTSGGSGEIKAIKTGPTEVQYYNDIESTNETASVISKTMAPGGIVDMLKQKICMLSARLVIFLPICDILSRNVVPSVGNRRRPHGLMGPNPPMVVKKGR